MSGDNKNDTSILDDLSKLNLTFYESSITLWRIEEMCRIKIKSIEEIKHSTEQVTSENKWIEKQLHDTKSRIDEVREDIISFDNITISFNETLAHLEIQHKKKEFTLNKLKCDYELQLFIKMELWQREEERLNNIPEVKLLKTADYELKNTILEYEELLINLQNLVEKIDIAKNENDKKRNNIIVEYAKVYFEMLSLNKREKNCKTLLRKLNEEYNEKCCLKNVLLESQNKKINKLLFWSYTPSTFDSNIFDIKLDSLNQDLKDDINIQNSKLNKPKRNVTFLLSSEDKIPLETNEENVNICKNINTFTVEGNENLNKNSSRLKNILNIENVEESIIQFTKKDLIESKKMDFENNYKHIGDDGNLNTNKCKTIDVLSDIKFKKPYHLLQDTSIMNPKIIQPSKMKTNKNINMNNNFNQEKVKSLSLSMNNNNHCDKNSILTDEDQSQKLNTLNCTEHSNLKNLNPDNINIFNDLSQLLHENVSDNQNKELSDTFWNFCAEPISQNSGNSSFCGSDLSELFGNSYDIIQSQDNTQFHFLNSFNSNSDVTPESNFQGIKISQQSGNFMFQPSQSESSKKINIDKNTLINEATSSTSNDFTQPNKTHFLSPDKFKFKFL